MHSYARFIQLLGKGSNGMPPLTREEALEAMRKTASEAEDPARSGEFLMPMRINQVAAERHPVTSLREADCQPGRGDGLAREAI